MKVAVVKTIAGFLKPAYESDHEAFKKMPINEIFNIEYTKGRNVMFHRKFFALLKLAFENQSDYRLMEDLRRDLIITSGRYDDHVNRITGECYKTAKSISFANMDELEFSELYNDIKTIICKWLGIDNETLDEEIKQYF